MVRRRLRLRTSGMGMGMGAGRRSRASGVVGRGGVRVVGGGGGSPVPPEFRSFFYFETTPKFYQEKFSKVWRLPKYTVLQNAYPFLTSPWVHLSMNRIPTRTK